MTPDLIEECARALATKDGLCFDEVCGLDDPDGHDECDSGTCVSAYYEDHDAEFARELYRRQALAVLATVQRVLSEPDEAMVEAAFHGWHDGSAAREGDCFDADMPYADYKRIIDGRKFECAFKAMLAASPLGEIEDA